MNIAIIGAGPGGLTLARLLQQNGFAVKVFERDANQNVRVQGATLNLNPGTGLTAIERCGLMAELKKAYRPGADQDTFLDPQAKLAFIVPSQPGSEHERPEIDRGPLRDLLLSSLKPETVIWDSQLLTMDAPTETHPQAVLHFKNQTHYAADLVIACEGANSKLRAYLTDVKPVYSGVTAIEGILENAEATIPELYQILDGGKAVALGESKTIMLILKGDNTVTYYLSLKSEETRFLPTKMNLGEISQIKSWFESEFKNWSPLFLDLIQKSKLPLVARPQYWMPVQTPWTTQPYLTLLGDAAHVMPPYAGEGVNMAMLDAVELTDELINPSHPNLTSALRAYEDKMRARMLPALASTLENTEMFHSPQAMEFFRKFFDGFAQ